MEIIRHSLLPRRLTQMYTDTKKSYEQIVQTNVTNPQLSSLHLKLRIQKDRLIAWGLEWADSNASQADDIDSSLDRAGISDLVASILSSIRELLDEADRIQPHSRPKPPGSYPDDKPAYLSTSWTAANLARLEDIVRDITASIDTLCDLSKSQQLIHRGPSNGNGKPRPHSQTTEKAPIDTSYSEPKITRHQSKKLSGSQSNLTYSCRIDPDDLFYPSIPQLPTVTPPSYDSTATAPGNRVFALLRNRCTSEKNLSSPDAPVLVDFYSEDGTSPKLGPLPSLQRFEDLILSLQGASQESEFMYSGSLRILGWLADSHHSRYAFVYEIPRPLSSPKVLYSPGTVSPPESLLSYLQHGGDVESSNVPCLEDRFRLAFNLATNLLHVHAKGLVHRNINSNNVIFVSDNGSQSTESMPWKRGIIRKPYLVSWDHCSDDTTDPEPETMISNIYRPPGIERGQRSSYNPAHDIYSLGLVLLEIGLWMPLNKLWKTKYTRLDFKRRLQALYAKKLAAKCGTAYMNAVEYCLNALNENHISDALVPPASRDHQSRGQNDYYWSVLKPLERCCALDESDKPTISPAPSATAAHLQTSGQESLVPSPTRPRPLKDSAEVSKSQPVEQGTWRTRKGYSPKYPGGVDLPIWSYVVDEQSEKYFHTVMAPKIDWMADKAINISESYELSTCMTGSSPETAKPTLLMVCKSLQMAWRILNYVNEEKQMFDIYVARGQLRRSKTKKKRGRKSKKGAAGEDKPGQHPTRYQQRPSCGASIGCFVDEQHSEAVTFGGVVLVNGEPHGMSVHHMLEDPDSGDDTYDEEDSTSDEMSDVVFAFDHMSTDMLDPISEFESLPNGFDALEIWKAEAENEENCHGDNEPRTRPGQGEPIIVTQPALDDVDPNYFPSEDEMSDDHLVIHGLGTIHASSGLRRLKYEDVAHEIDWALFKLHGDRMPTTNAIDGALKHCKKADQGSFPSQILKADALGDLKVHAFGSTSGLQTGMIRPKMELTRMPGRRLLSPVWKFEGQFGVGGDSGAWIIDNETGGLCGHVSSFSESQQYGVLAPMEAQLHDMEETLCAKVALPAGGQDSYHSFREQILEENTAGHHPALRKFSTGFSLRSGDCEPDETQSRDDSSPPNSPEVATSPPPSSQQASTPGTMSLNDVAEKWECKRNSMDLGKKDEKAIGGKVSLRGGALKATC